METVQDIKNSALSAVCAWYARRCAADGHGMVFTVPGLRLGDQPADVQGRYSFDATGVAVFTWVVNGRPADDGTIDRIIAHTERREAERAAPEDGKPLANPDGPAVRSSSDT